MSQSSTVSQYTQVTISVKVLMYIIEYNTIFFFFFLNNFRLFFGVLLLFTLNLITVFTFTILYMLQYDVCLHGFCIRNKFILFKIRFCFSYQWPLSILVYLSPSQ